MPTTNMAEMVYAKWQRQSGPEKTNLYTATSDDLCRAVMQQSRYYKYLLGKCWGTGPDMHELKLRSTLRSGNATRISSVVRGVVQDIPLHSRRQGLEGEERTVKVPCTHDCPIDSPNGSWRSDYNLRTKPVRWGDTPSATTSSVHEDVCDGTNPPPLVVTHCPTTQAGIVSVEQDIDPSKWHIARCGMCSNIKCSGSLSTNHVKCDNQSVHDLGGSSTFFLGSKERRDNDSPD